MRNEGCYAVSVGCDRCDTREINDWVNDHARTTRRKIRPGQDVRAKQSIPARPRSKLADVAGSRILNPRNTIARPKSIP